MRPCPLRPPLLVSGRTSDFSGVDRVISSKSETDDPRRPGVVGLHLRIAMSSSLLSGFPGAYATGPPKISMGLLSAEMVTSARLVSLRVRYPKRGGLRWR